MFSSTSRKRDIIYVLVRRSVSFMVCMAVMFSSLLVNSTEKKQPLRMMWQVHPYLSAEEIFYLSEVGINVVQSFPFFKSSDSVISEFLALAEKHGIGVIPYVGSFVDFSKRDCKISVEGRNSLLQLSNSRAIYAWHAFDEPFLHQKATAECQLAIYDELKQLTPQIPVMASYNNSRAIHYWRNFTPDAADIIDLHRYSNPYPGEQQQALVDLARKNFKFDSKTVIVTIRAFNSPDESRELMTSDSLLESYNHFFIENSVTDNIGFYGWHLSPNIGIKNLPEVRRQFVRIMERLREGNNQ